MIEPRHRPTFDADSEQDSHTSEPAVIKSVRRGSGRAVVATLIAAVAGGLAGWGIIEAFDGELVTATIGDEDLTGDFVAPAVLIKQDEIRRAATIRNVAVCSVLLGAAIASLIGLTQGVLHRRISRAALGVAGGLLMGALAGFAAGLAGEYFAERLVAAQLIPASTRPLIAHVVLWGSIGGSSGLAAWLASRRERGAAGPLGLAAAGGVFAALIYAIVQPVLFPLAAAESTIPEDFWSRLLWVSLAATLIGLATGRALGAGSREHALTG